MSVNIAQYILIIGIKSYRWILSPAKTALLGPAGRCRFEPSCSAYALEALQAHGAVKGTWLAVHRLCRCHPWGKFGPDPVPKGQVSSVECRVEDTDRGICDPHAGRHAKATSY